MITIFSICQDKEGSQQKSQYFKEFKSAKNWTSSLASVSMNKIKYSEIQKNKVGLRGGHEFFMIEVIYHIELHTKKKISAQINTKVCLILVK